MSLSSIKAMKSERGFTIVELLIVIVVIGILAAIVIVAFNGVQNRAKAQSSQASAANVQKKIEAYNAATGSYPTFPITYAALTTLLNGQNESTLAGSGVTLGTPVNTTTTTVGIHYCSAGGTGISVTWYDYAAATPAAVTGANGLKINYSGACTTWTAST